MPYQALADVVLCMHVAVVLFVVGGLPLVVIGNSLSWHWANSLWLRLAHLAAIAVVVAESWIGYECPLTTLESWLRFKGGAASYDSQGFIAYWLQRFLFYSAPAWVFTVVYTVFALAVLAVWWYFPPASGRRRGSSSGG